MCLPIPSDGARSGPYGLPLWLGMALMLALLMVVSASQANAHPEALSGSADHPIQADRPLALDATPSPSAHQHAAPTEHPHCHHGQDWRPTTGVLPRSEAPDAAPDPLAFIASLVGPSVHQTAAFGRVLPGLTSRPAVPLYLLTQRFRS